MSVNRLWKRRTGMAASTPDERKAARELGGAARCRPSHAIASSRARWRPSGAAPHRRHRRRGRVQPVVLSLGHDTGRRRAGIAMLTPGDVHHGRTRPILRQRQPALRLAWTRHPERSVHRAPKPRPLPAEVSIDPPDAVLGNHEAMVRKTLVKPRAAHPKRMDGAARRSANRRVDPGPVASPRRRDRGHGAPGPWNRARGRHRFGAGAGPSQASNAGTEVVVSTALPGGGTQERGAGEDATPQAP